MNTQEILDKLNAYQGDNVWQDIILHLDDYDEAATDALLGDVDGSDRLVLTEGTMIRFDRSSRSWIEQS